MRSWKITSLPPLGMDASRKFILHYNHVSNATLWTISSQGETYDDSRHRVISATQITEVALFASDNHLCLNLTIPPTRDTLLKFDGLKGCINKRAGLPFDVVGVNMRNDPILIIDFYPNIARLISKLKLSSLQAGRPLHGVDLFTKMTQQYFFFAAIFLSLPPSTTQKRPIQTLFAAFSKGVCVQPQSLPISTYQGYRQSFGVVSSSFC